MKDESSKTIIKRLLETPDQAKAIVFANELAETLKKYSERSNALGLDVLTKVYRQMSGMIRDASEMQLRVFRQEGTLLNQLEQSVVLEMDSRSKSKPKDVQPKPKDGMIQNMFTGEMEKPHDAKSKKSRRNRSAR
ncbi:hypothetical protein L0244_38690 [bacterium]|nr:hypothetical protein [bacterium]